MQSTLTIFAFLHPLCFPSLLQLVPTPGQDLFYPPMLHFIKVYINCSKGFCLGISYTLICQTSIRLISSIIYSFSIILFPYYSSAFSTFCYVVFIHICSAFQYYSLSFSFPVLPPHCSHRQICYYYHSLCLYLYLTISIAISMHLLSVYPSICICTYSYVYALCICLSFRSSFHIRENMWLLVF
jgi:hypothetical protein